MGLIHIVDGIVDLASSKGSYNPELIQIFELRKIEVANALLNLQQILKAIK